MKRKSKKATPGPFEGVEEEKEGGGVEKKKEQAPHYEVIRKELYIAARLVDKKGVPKRVDMVGMDIGKAHTGICGFDCSSQEVKGDNKERGGWPRVTAIALINAGGGRGQAAHFACDVLDELFARDEGMKWVRESDKVYVEQQLPLNPQAKQVAQGIRSGLRCLRMAIYPQNNEHKDFVSFVAGQSKYLVAPVVCPERALGDPLRAPGVVLRGHANKPKRKLLGERDAHAILESTNQLDAVKMISGMCEGVDQIHDVTDAMLIGMAGEVKKNTEEDKRMKKMNKTKSGATKVKSVKRRRQ